MVEQGGFSTKSRSFLKRKKEAKKEKRIKMWITRCVTHILIRQTNNNNY
jgi:hypothetical protein